MTVRMLAVYNLPRRRGGRCIRIKMYIVSSISTSTALQLAYVCTAPPLDQEQLIFPL